jgi:protein transport protein SEC31
VSNDLGELVKTRPLAKWRETLAILCTYAPAEEWGALAGVLAGRLESAGNGHAASLCHICAGDVDAAVTHWMGSLPAGKVAPSAIHGVLEKAVVLTRATGQASGTGLSSLAVSYAEMLISEGQLSAAISYLDMVPDGGDAVKDLRDRIVRGGGGSLATTSAPVAPAAAPAAAPAQHSTYGGYSQQPQASQYGAYAPTTAGGAYGQTQQSAYGQTQQSAYGQTQQSAYGQTQQSAYSAYD